MATLIILNVSVVISASSHMVQFASIPKFLSMNPNLANYPHGKIPISEKLPLNIRQINLSYLFLHCQTSCMTLLQVTLPQVFSICSTRHLWHGLAHVKGQVETATYRDLNLCPPVKLSSRLSIIITPFECLESCLV